MNNKAPAGFGLGYGYGGGVPDGDLDNAIANGWYTLAGTELNGPTDADNVPGFSRSILIVSSARADSVKSQRIILGASGLQQYEMRRVYNLNEWTPWEWIYPPMIVGLEYRTTERFNGKPVYAKLVNLGTPTDGKSVSIGSDYLIEAQVIMVFPSYTLPSPELPYGATANSLPSPYGSGFYTNKNEVILVCGNSLPEATAYARVKYTKEAP